MKKIIVIFSFMLLISSANAVEFIPFNPKSVNEISKTLTVKEFLNLTPENIQHLLGRELTFKERLSLKLNQKKLRKQLARNPFYGNDYRRHTNFWIGLLIGVVVVLVIVLLVSKK